MNANAGRSPWARLRALPNDSTEKILVVAVGVCLVCSILVSSAAVLLKPIQERNAALGRQKEILKVAGLYHSGVDVAAAFRSIKVRYLDLHTGDLLDGDTAPAQKPEPIPAREDIAGVGERPRYMPVYLIDSDAGLETVILPLVGKGLWSTIHGFVALSNDGARVKAITFFDHAETPGLGGEVSNPAWLAKWQGKQLGAADGHVRLSVIKGHVNPASADAAYEVDGLSGATLTANGVTRIIHYWLGDSGFGPFLAKLRNRSHQGGMTHE